MMADRDVVFDKPMTYETDTGIIVYRGSSLGSCVGALTRSRMGITASAPSDFMQSKFDEGSAWEERVIERFFEDYGSQYSRVVGHDSLSQWGTILEGGSTGSTGDQVEVEIVTGKTTRVKLHPDTFAIDKTDGRAHVVEMKFLSGGFAKTKSADDFGDVYEWQFSAEMVGTGLPGLYVIAVKKMGDEGSADEGKVVGISGVALYRRAEPKHDLAAIRARVNEVEKYLRDGVVPKCPLPLMYPCGYWAEHDEKEETPEIEDEVMRDLIDAYLVETRVMGNAKDAADELRKTIEQRMGELDVPGGKVKGKEGAVQVSRVAHRPGNVSWKNAYDALAKVTGEKVDQDAYRGKDVAGGIRIEIEKTEGET